MTGTLKVQKVRFFSRTKIFGWRAGELPISVVGEPEYLIRYAGDTVNIIRWDAEHALCEYSGLITWIERCDFLPPIGRS